MVWGQDHTDPLPGQSPPCVIILQPCAGKAARRDRESWGLLACGITAVLCEWMSQLLSLSILFWVEVMRTERVARAAPGVSDFQPLVLTAALFLATQRSIPEQRSWSRGPLG